MSKQPSKKWIMFTLRWGIAVAGVTWVLWNLHFRDRLQVLTPANKLADVQVVGYPPERAAEFHVWGSIAAGEPAGEHVVRRDQVWTNRSDRKFVVVRGADGGVRKMDVLGIRPPNDGIEPKLLVRDPDTGGRAVVDPSQVVDAKGYHAPAYPLIEIGLNRMVHEADWRFLLAALCVMPASYLLTSFRWHLLLKMVDVSVSQGRAFVINMVGAFYNSFMPGSTGGDVIKAYYASKHTEHRTRAVMSVLVDRAIGLLALLILGGTMAAFQYNENLDCRRVTHVSGLLLAATAVGAVVFYHRGLRRISGLAWVIKRLPMQGFVQNAVHTMELYGRHPFQMFVVLLLCFPVHITAIISATLAGLAFKLNIEPITYYWVVIPVIALVGALPISPQGAGVMEFFAIKLLTIRHPVSVGQAVALVLSIRLIQMFWNLIAGVFVLRGGYHAPTTAEQHELEEAVEGEHDTEADERTELPRRPPTPPPDGLGGLGVQPAR